MINPFSSNNVIKDDEFRNQGGKKKSNPIYEKIKKSNCNQETKLKGKELKEF